MALPPLTGVPHMVCLMPVNYVHVLYMQMTPHEPTASTTITSLLLVDGEDWLVSLVAERCLRSPPHPREV